MTLRFQKKKFKKVYPEKLFKQFQVGLDKTGRKFLEDFSLITGEWKKQRVKYLKEKDYKPTGFSIYVYTKNKIFMYLNSNKKTGTYPIKVKNAPNLAFNWDGYGSYVAGSTPNHVGFNKPQQPSTRVKFKKVNHPYVEARNWTTAIAKNNEDWFNKEMHYRVEKGLRDSKFIR